MKSNQNDNGNQQICRWHDLFIFHDHFLYLFLYKVLLEAGGLIFLDWDWMRANGAADERLAVLISGLEITFRRSVPSGAGLDPSVRLMQGWAAI